MEFARASSFHLANSCSCHGAPFHPLRAGTGLYAGQGHLLAAPGYDDFPCVHQLGAGGNSTANKQALCEDGCSYAAGGHIVVDNLDLDAKPITAACQAFGGHFLAGNIVDANGDGFITAREPLSAADEQAPAGPFRGHPCSLNVNGDAKLILMAYHHYQALGVDMSRHLRANARAGGFAANGERLGTAGHVQALGGHYAAGNAHDAGNDFGSVPSSGHLGGCFYAPALESSGPADAFVPMPETTAVQILQASIDGAAWPSVQANSPVPQLKRNLDILPSFHAIQNLGILEHVQALGGHYAAGYAHDGGNGVGFVPSSGHLGGSLYGPGMEPSGAEATVQIIQEGIDGNGHAGQNSGVDGCYYGAAWPSVQASWAVPGLDSCYDTGNIHRFEVDADGYAAPHHSVVEGCYYAAANAPVPGLQSCYDTENMNIVHRFDVDVYSGAGAGPTLQANIDEYFHAVQNSGVDAWCYAAAVQTDPELESCYDTGTTSTATVTDTSTISEWAPLQQGRPTDTSSISEATVQSAWRDNCVEVFECVLDMLRRPRRHLYVALDLEFVAGASTDVHYYPNSWIDWYQHLHTFVNGGDVVQVGLALAFEPLEHRHGHGSPSPAPVTVLEINLEFDEGARQYNAASISFLAAQGHRLAEHRDRGVTADQFLDGLLRHLPLAGDGDSSTTTWVTFHGDRDFGFLLRLLQPGALPPERTAFMRQVRETFPVFYDVRVLGQLVNQGFRGSLASLAKLLGVRPVGGEHHAGSDALLTMSCFSEILRRLSRHELLHRLDSRLCLLSGMEEYDMAIKCARHIDDDVSFTTVDVRGHNFHAEAWRIDELVTSNFKTLGVDVLLPRLCWGSGSPLHAAAADQEDYYDRMKSILKGIGEFQVTIGFMKTDGMLAYGRLWRFHLRCFSSLKSDLIAGESDDCVHPRQLAWFLASCGATHNPQVVWATYKGSQGIACLIKSFLLADDDLPIDWCSYVERRRGRFPGMYDVGLIAQRWPDIGVLPPTATGSIAGLNDIARNLKVVKAYDEQPVERAALVLRCYKRLAESPYFPFIASAVRGQLMPIADSEMLADCC